MSQAIDRSFAEVWTESVLGFQRTGKERYVWFEGGRFRASLDDEEAVRRSNHQVVEVGQAVLDDSLSLPGAASFLRGAILVEALRVATYWMSILGPAAPNPLPPGPPPRLPFVIGTLQWESFAQAYSDAVAGAIRSQIAHVVDYDYYAEGFVASLKPPWYGATDVPMIVAAATARTRFGDGLRLDPRQPDFDEGLLRTRALDFALSSGLAERESEAIMRKWWCGCTDLDPNYPEG